MRVYEEMFIVRPDITEEQLDPMIEGLKTTISTGGGSVDKVEKMGVKKLAYRVEKRMEGYYVLIQFQAPNSLVRELERRLRVNDDVMKFMTVRIDEQIKRNEKLAQKRSARAARKPPAGGPSMPHEAAPPMPGSPMPGSPMPGAAVPGAPMPSAPMPSAPMSSAPLPGAPNPSAPAVPAEEGN
jgi:small subunit ribosomal protein S6